MTQKLAAAVFTFAVSLAPAMAQEAQPQQPWHELFLTDLAAARDRIASSHPGSVDKENPQFARVLDSAYRDAAAMAPRVLDYNDYRIALMQFGNRFQDAHLSVSASRRFENVQFAGLIPMYRDGAFVVADADARYGDLKGATLISCDGMAARELFEKRVLSWRGRPGIVADWYTHAPTLFLHYSDLIARRPAACQFRTGSGVRDVTLEWTPADLTQLNARIAALAGFGARTLSLEKLDDGRVLWVHLPTFAPRDAAEIDVMKTLIASFQEEIARNRTWQLVVFDLRGNSGGSSAWGQQLVAALYGNEYSAAASRYLGDGVFTEWRVSKENVAAVAGLVKQLTDRHGADHPNTTGMKQFHQQMTGALARGDQLLPTGSAGARNAPRPMPPALPGRVVAITSSSCFSACLDFLDQLKLDPKLVHAGEPTGVDTVYMENWGGPLPSGIGSISHPMKVYRNRRRGNNVGYVPNVPHASTLRDTATLQQWVRDNHRTW